MGLFADMHGRADQSRLVLFGHVVTMNAKSEVFDDGFVCIADDAIKAVGKKSDGLPPEFAHAPGIVTGGTIFPGLVELHNHLPYNMLPLWDVPRKFTDRNTWRLAEPRYNPDIAWPAKILTANPDKDFLRAVVRYSECRSLFGGVTTGEGITVSTKPNDVNVFRGLVRNVEAPEVAGWPVAFGNTLDYSRDDVRKTLWPGLQKKRPYFYHVAEGNESDDVAHQHFLDLELDDGTWAINSNLVAIHCTALREQDFERMASSAGIVWSPLSNLLLYGTTTNVRAAIAAGVPISLGADWSPSGSKNLLGELKVAKIVGDHLGGLFSAEQLAKMVTTVPAAMTQWSEYIGSLEPGRKADLLAFDNKAASPYDALIQASEADIVAVLIDGRPRLGRANIMAFDPSQQEIVSIGGRDYVLDLTEKTAVPLDGMSLSTAVSKLSDGLRNMPELGRNFPKDTAKGFAFGSPPMSLHLDLEPIQADAAFLAGPPIDPTQLHPMELSPITEIDDASFRTQVRANRNIPEYLRDALR